MEDWDEYLEQSYEGEYFDSPGLIDVDSVFLDGCGDEHPVVSLDEAKDALRYEGVTVEAVFDEVYTDDGGEYYLDGRGFLLSDGSVVLEGEWS